MPSAVILEAAETVGVTSHEGHLITKRRGALSCPFCGAFLSISGSTYWA
jgi:hypothetical protein